MAKYYGPIGFATQVESSPGVWIEEIIERYYAGDMLRISRQLQSANQVNDNINISNELSIVADPYVNENFHAIRYAEFRGTKWKVSNIRLEYPRLVMTLGGLYNG